MPPGRSTATARSTAISWSCRTATRRSTRDIPSAGRSSTSGPSSSHAKGIRQVNGHLIGDDNAFDEPGWGVGWAWDDLHSATARRSARCNTTRTRSRCWSGPGLEAGVAGHHQRLASRSGLTIDHQVTTAAAGEPSRISCCAPPGTRPADGERTGCARCAGDHRVRRRSTIRRRSISTRCARRLAVTASGSSGRPLDIDAVLEAPDMSKATLLVEDKSPPLAEIIDVTPEVEPQHLRGDDCCDRWRPPARRKPRPTASKHVERRSTSGASSAQYFLARDGSGLSRYDYLTADALTWLLTYMWRDPNHADLFRVHVAGVRRQWHARESLEGHARQRPRVGEDRVNVTGEIARRLHCDRRGRTAGVCVHGEWLPRAVARD